MQEYERKLIALFNDSTGLTAEAKLYVLLKHLTDVKSAVQAENQYKKEVSTHEQMPQSDRLA